MSSPPPSATLGSLSNAGESRKKSFFQKLKSGEAVPSLSQTFPIDTFRPQSLDDEITKAARIVRTFFMDGFTVPYQISDKAKDVAGAFQNGFRGQLLRRANVQALKGCKAVIIFHAFRKGLDSTPTDGGSGVVVARLPDGTWSPPSAILVKTSGWNVLASTDIYDCMCIVNDQLHKVTQPECTLGLDILASTGPISGDDSMIARRSANPLWTYVKGRGEWAEIDMSGTIIYERIDENERSYGVEDINSRQILAAEVKPSSDYSVLWETLTAFDGQGRGHVKMPAAGKTPGEYRIKYPKD